MNDLDIKEINEITQQQDYEEGVNEVVRSVKSIHDEAPFVQ